MHRPDRLAPLLALLVVGCPEPEPSPVGGDADADGFLTPFDCDDADAAIHPGAADPFGDGLDQNCDGVDGSDRDRDGYPGTSDCDDTNPHVNPGAQDNPSSPEDSNCDGVRSWRSTADDWIDLAANLGMACGLHADGTAECWGEDLVEPAPGTEFTQIVVGSNGGACGLLPSGLVECWGTDDPWDPPTDGLRLIDIPPDHEQSFLCGITLDGEAKCWINGAPSGNSWDDGPTWVSMHDACAIDDAGAVVCPIFGSGPEGAPPLADISSETKWHAGLGQDGDIHTFRSPPFGVPDSIPGPFISMDSGRASLCAIREGGAMECWGDRIFDQGLRISGSFTKIAAGRDFNCALRTDGAIECWGGDEAIADAAIPP